jgi:hypothetical protein
MLHEKRTRGRTELPRDDGRSGAHQLSAFPEVETAMCWRTTRVGQRSIWLPRCV